MDGKPMSIASFIEGQKTVFTIPVYQRQYDWTIENCDKLYSDLKKVVQNERERHFFGCIVAQGVTNGGSTEYYVIDGQQRLTTVTLLFLAIKYVIENDMVDGNQSLPEQILDCYLTTKYSPYENKIKMRLIDHDRLALNKLIDGYESDFIENSTVTENFNFFVRKILEEREIKVDDLYAAVEKLEIIIITLDSGDNPQLIFESLNSTGLDLTEGDKIRNFVLMDLEPDRQTDCYKKYWKPIEACTRKDINIFIRDYLSIKQQYTPNKTKVYVEFKNYSSELALPVEVLLADMLKYARIYERLILNKVGIDNKEFKQCLFRLNRLEIVVIRPYLMQVIDLYDEGKITEEDVIGVFELTENYLLRRNICEAPTNALRKIYLTMNREIVGYENNYDRYLEKYKYNLSNRTKNARFPDDEEFKEELKRKQVYAMTGKYKDYLFEKFETYKWKEALSLRDIYDGLDENRYTIEHIMPQTLTAAWKESLGDDYENVHATWLHRLANLTLTGYNSSLSNNDFNSKSNFENGGYKQSNFRMSRAVGEYDKWTETELKDRSEHLANMAVEIWTYPQTTYKPAKKDYETMTLDDIDIDITGKDIFKFSYKNNDVLVKSWSEMIEKMLVDLYKEHTSVMLKLALNASQYRLDRFVSTNENQFVDAIKVDSNLYVKLSGNPQSKLMILKRIVELCEEDPMDVVFFMKQGIALNEPRQQIRKEYWTYALPILQKANEEYGLYANVVPVDSNWQPGSFNVSGFSINVVSNMDCVKVEFYLGKSNKDKNKKAFEYLVQFKEEIEEQLDIALYWDNREENKCSIIGCEMHGVSLRNKSDWERMVTFQAKWSNEFARVFLPYIKNIYPKCKLKADLDEHSKISSEMQEKKFEWIKQWLSKKNNNKELIWPKEYTVMTYGRFKTSMMQRIMPDLESQGTGWNRDNYYFYEIVNNKDNRLKIKLVFKHENMPSEYEEIVDYIVQNVDCSCKKSGEWLWKTVFSTSNITLDQIDESTVMDALDMLFEEVKGFEDKLDSLFIK